LGGTSLSVWETLYYSQEIIGAGIEGVSQEQLMAMGYSKRAVQERIAIGLILTQPNLEKYEDVLVHILLKGSGDEAVRWKIAGALADYVPKSASNHRAILAYCRKCFRRKSRTGWYIALNLARNGRYPELNDFLLGFLKIKKVNPEFQVLMIGFGPAILGEDWKDILADNLDFSNPVVAETWAREVEGEKKPPPEIGIDLKEREDQIKGALLGHVVGDVIGAPVELMKLEEIKRRYGVVDDLVQNDQALLPDGEYTDDSCLAFIGMDNIVANSNFELIDYARRLGEQAVMMDGGQDCDRHFSHRTTMCMRHLSMGQDPRFTGYESGKNGAAIRVLPLVVLDLYDPQDNLRKNVEEACGATHIDEVAQEGAYLLALALRECFELNGGDPSMLIDKLIEECQVEMIKEKLELARRLLAEDASFSEAASEIGTGSRIEESLPYTLFCFLKNPKDFKKVVVSAINVDGDSDSLAAMAGSLCGALNGADSIPGEWVEKIECKDKIESYF